MADLYLVQIYHTCFEQNELTLSLVLTTGGRLLPGTDTCFEQNEVTLSLVLTTGGRLLCGKDTCIF